MNETVSVIVVAREHANQDSLPLRFGLHFTADAELVIFDAVDLGPDDRYADRRHYEGNIHLNNDENEEPQKGHFVVGRRKAGNYLSLVTAWRNDNQDVEYYLSNTMRNLREEGFLTPEKLIEMHPFYLSGEICSSGSLMRYLSKNLAETEVERAKASEERARVETENALAEIEAIRAEKDAALREAQNARSVALEAIEAAENLELRANKAENAEKEALVLLAEAREKLKQRDAQFESTSTQPETLPKDKEPAVAVTKAWQSKTGSSYRNLGIEANVIDVRRVGDAKIRLIYIAKNGEEKSIEDFGYQGFVKPVFDYLMSRKDKRAIFLVTQKPGGELKLAADTMMLPAYRALWS